MFAPVPPAHRKGDLVASGVLLALPLVLAFPVFVLWGIVLFVALDPADGRGVRVASELLVWQAPLALWIATLVAVVVLAIRRRRALPTARLGVGLIALPMLAALAVPLVASAA